MAAGAATGCVYGYVTGAATAICVLAVVLAARLGVAAGRWRPLRGRNAVVSRLPMVAFLAAVVPAGAWLGHGAWSLASAALRARSASIRLPPLAQGSRVLSADGQPVAVFHADVRRQTVPLSKVAPVVVSAVVATEDARFWHHGGVDLYGLGRAIVADLSPGGHRQGASTLAMQLVKNTIVRHRADDLRTKVAEAVLANRLEGRLGKRAVLADYLNTVYFGSGAYGVQAAAQTYFDKPASALDAAQAALLAGLIQDPTGYDPVSHPTAAGTRRHEVLRLMVDQGRLTRAEARSASAAPLPKAVHLPPPGRSYFLEAVKQELLSSPALGSTPQQRYRSLFYGGLTVRTTLDTSIQAAATAAVAHGLPHGKLSLSAALAAVDPATGAVRAVVGGPGYSVSQFDAALATPGRPTGSAFKVFTLVAALQQGYTPRSLVDGSEPCAIPDPGNTPNPWVVSNFAGEQFGRIDLATATADSVNCAFARLAMKVGLSNIAAVAHRMGVTVPLAAVPSMTLGTNSVPPIQMAAAYATLADGGVYHQPRLVSEVDGPHGEVLLRRESHGVRAISRRIALTTTAVLRQVVRGGTGTAAAVPGRQVAGKTGTGQDYTDAWFVGYTPRLAAAVWMGSPDGEVPMRGVGGINVVGGSYPAHIWSAFVSAALGGTPAGAFPAPPAPLAPPAPAGRGTGGHTRVTTWCRSSCRPGRNHHGRR